LIAIAANFAMMAADPPAPGKPDYTRAAMGGMLIIGGLLLGVGALFGIRKSGKSGILIPALAGIGINGFLIVMGILPFLLLAKHRAHLEPAVHSPSALLLRNDRLNFSLDIPEGFRDMPEGRQAPTMEHFYAKGSLSAGEPLTCINIERLNGLIPKNKPLKREHLPPGFDGELTTRNWRGVKVDTFVATVERNGMKVTVYSVQVPLKPSGIQLNVGGPESKRAELEELTDTLLASLEGETNW
jgi:hypothetical protein